MSRLFIVLIACSVATGASASELEAVAFTVSADRTSVRSGPGDEHYATAQLEPGTQIEVYRRDGSWLGMRPPEGSFCWVRADQLQRTENIRVAKVVGKEVVAWIGSTAEDVTEHRWQVRLRPGELVEVLGEAQFAAFQGSEKAACFRVAPPAGEYRWVHEHDVSPVDQPFPADDLVELADFEVTTNDRPEQPDDVFVARAPRRNDAQASDLRIASRSDGLTAARSLRSFTGKNFDERVRNLDLELALAVSKSPSTWELTPLSEEAESLAKSASSTLQRARSQVILTRLAEYESLQRRYAGLGDTLTGSHRQPSIRAVTANAEIDPPQDLVEPAEIDPRFDGTGWLLPVHSKKRESPPYALLDDDGQILQFVSPAPGLNLHRYLRKEVGVFGQRDGAATLRKPHLTAHRVIDLSRHRR